MLVGGDVLFAGSIGRGDLPGGDIDLLIDGIREKARQQKSGVNGELIRFLFDRPGVRSKENNVLLSGNDLKTDVDGLLCRFNVLPACWKLDVL